MENLGHRHFSQNGYHIARDVKDLRGQNRLARLPVTQPTISYTQVNIGGIIPTLFPSTTGLRLYENALPVASFPWASWSSFTIDVNLTDSSSHQVALYCLDWDQMNRSQLIEVLDASNGTVLDSQIISGFTNGQYLVWNLAGHVTFRITTLSGNAVVSGVFFGGASGLQRH